MRCVILLASVNAHNAR